MHSFKKSLLALSMLSMGIILAAQASAFQPKETSRYFNGPTITAVTGTTANVSLSPSVLNDLTAEEKVGIYFEYGETHQVCIMIYPTPVSCLPKKTDLGRTEALLTGLKPNTSYTITYKRDNTTRCITTPCPTNDFESMSVEFTTTSSSTATSTPVLVEPVILTKNLSFGSIGTQVVTLQNALIKEGYLKVPASGFFGVLTRRAVIEFQKAHELPTTGFVGPLTRGALAGGSSVATEAFEGTVTAYSVGCFVDGECSITVDGKKVVTTIGWSQQVVGQVKGIPDFGSIEQKVGAHAKVYAKKTADGYTLYGSSDYYVEVQ